MSEEVKGDLTLDDSHMSEYQRILACHEAGHTVASYLYKRRIKYVTIKPNIDWEDEDTLDCEGIMMPGRSGDRTGHDVEMCLASKKLRLPFFGGRYGFQAKENVKAWIERECIINLAGYVAEEVVTGNYENEFLAYQSTELSARLESEDRLKVSQFCDAVCFDEVEAKAYFNYLLERTRNIIRLPAHQCAIETLAAELVAHRTIGGRRAMEIIKAAITQTLLECVSSRETVAA